jgi:MarR-like DNA-binding transcriptional regulator SgrR of sgrS sRNA
MGKRKKLDSGRPWLLGTNDIPPPMRVPWQMWSKSSDPHQQGLIQFEFTEEGLSVGWCPHGFIEKDVIPWAELAWMAGSQHPDLKSEAEWIKEQAQSEGYKLAREMVMKELQTKVNAIVDEADRTGNPFLLKHAQAWKEIMKELK